MAALQRKHPKALGNTLIAAFDMWVQQTFPVEQQASIYRAMATSLEFAATQVEAEQAGTAIGPAQGLA